MTLLEFADLVQMALAVVTLIACIAAVVRRHEGPAILLFGSDLLCATVWGTLAIREYFENPEPQLWIIGGEVFMMVVFIYFSRWHANEDDWKS